MNTLVVNVNKQIGGYNFSLSPKARKEVIDLFPGAFQLPHIFISYDTKFDFEGIYGPVEKHILPVLTGVETDQLSSKIQRILFVDPTNNMQMHTILLSNVKEA